MTKQATWVAKRAKCTLPGVLQTLKDHAEIAVEAANAILPAHLKEFPFALHSSEMRFSASGYPMGSERTDQLPPRVSFIIDSGANNIRVESTSDNGPAFRIAQQWDVLEEKCKLRVWSDPQDIVFYEPEQIVQLALEPLFFV